MLSISLSLCFPFIDFFLDGGASDIVESRSAWFLGPIPFSDLLRPDLSNSSLELATVLASS